MAKRMRLPNGFGQISELKGRRLRNKFRAMVTLNWTDTGKPIRHTVGYFKSYNEAYQALMEYHKNPYDPEKDITVKELYELWKNRHFKKISQGSTSLYESAWKRCKPLYDVKIQQLSVPKIKVLVESDIPPTAQRNIKILLGQMLDYAVEYEMIEKNYARMATVDYKAMETNAHIPYSDEEMKKMWENNTTPMVTFTLIQCYTGFRPGELIEIEIENINLDNWTIIGGKKTKAGRNRIVPIHKRIRPLILDLYDPNNKRLFENIKYGSLRYMIQNMCSDLLLSPEHRPHDGRVTFVTNMKEAGADEYAIKLIVGHAINDITEATYTYRSVEWLHKEVDKLL